MEHLDVRTVKKDPKPFLDFMKSNRYEFYHKSNIFFRDFQYGLWRYLKESQTKVSYADMEKVTKEVIDAWENRGLVKRINRQTFELNMPEYYAGEFYVEPVQEAPKPKPAPAAPAAKAPAAPAAPAAATPAAAASGAAPKLHVPPGTDPEKAAKIAELQARMAAAKAKREAEGG
ncbi:MAG: hypothetical protein JWQ98_972 [Chlorobi bacterium]|nr:hypothetical protein [Chlorobiota bacterium]